MFDKDYLRSLIRDIKDFPQKGIVFKDITTVLKDPAGMHLMGWHLMQQFRTKAVTKVVGIEARGFIGGSVLAYELGCGFVPARKPGKLPADTVAIDYEKEYGTDTIQIHRDAIGPDDVVVIHDDILATGGTMRAAYDLVKSMGAKEIYLSFILEIEALKGREKLPEGVEVHTLLEF